MVLTIVQSKREEVYMNFRAIGFRLVAGGCVAVIIPLIIVGIISISKSSTSLEGLSKTNGAAAAMDIATLVNKTLEEEKKLALAFASDRGVRAVAAKVHTAGIEGAADEISVLRQEMKAKYQLLGDEYLGIFVANAKGFLYTGELVGGKEYKGSNISSRTYFQKAKSTRKAVVGDVARSKSTGKLMSVVCAPIFSKSGEFIGAFGISMKASLLTDLVTAKKAGKTGYAFMIDKAGIINAHPVAKHVLALDLKTLKDMDGITRQMMAGKAGVESYVFKGVSKIAGFAPVAQTGWSVSVTQNADEFLAASKSIRNQVLIIGIIALIATALGIFFAAKGITNPINKAVDGLKDIAEGEGDLTMRLEVTTKDEIGELAKWFNTFIEKLQGIIDEISQNANKVGTSSSDLLTIASAMATGSQDTSQRAGAVAAATEEMSANLNAVAAAMEESSTNTSMVATAAEEMSATISEIAQNSENAKGISESAVTQAQNATEKMSDLGVAANAIGKVTETITEISEQTNLLALNATIEAARAGEAGKGFAVVANEIKELAKQTAEATQDIKTKIDGIQSTTKLTVTEIEEITRVINQINDIVTTIATSVEEQSAATQEIANNIAQASQGIQDVNENVTQSSSVSTEISRDIAEVNVSADEMSNSSSQINLSAEQLRELSNQLETIVGSFRI